MNLKNYKYWIFDMDGTLTVPIHDFHAILKELEIPENEDILGFLDALPKEESERKHKRLQEIELEMAYKSEAQEQIPELLELLSERGCSLGVITKNNLINTKITLKAAGLNKFFDPKAVLTRECAAPKPAPDAVHQLLEMWNGNTEQAVIVGDYSHDLNAGKAAGISTIYFDSRNVDHWHHLADISVKQCSELIDLLK